MCTNRDWSWAILRKVWKIRVGLLKMKESMIFSLARISHCARKTRKTSSLAVRIRRRALSLTVQIGFLSLGDVMHFDSAPSR